MSSYRAALASRAPDAAARVLTEIDPGRQLRRLRRRLASRTFDDELRSAVADKRILVTGASSGIGHAVALRLLAAGAHVLLVARRADRLDELVAAARDTDGRAIPYPCDLSDRDQIAALVQRLITEHGGVDIVINNAGRSIRRTLHGTAGRLHDYERVMALNFFGAVWLTAPLVEQMRRSGSGGHVINVSTMGTQFYGTPRFAAYMASKGALDQFADSVAPETRADGVRWTTVHMPLVQTEMIAPAQHAWNFYPKLSLDTGAAMVLDAVVRAPARVAHPLGNLTATVERLAPRLLHAYKAREFKPTPPAPLPRVAIVGAGMSGLAMALRLRAAGSDNFVIYEKAHTVGGTWRDNTYPGLECDVFAHYYCYRDDLEPGWTKLFAPGNEIRDYFENIADRHDLRRNISFGTEIVSGAFENGQWRLRTADGREDVADVLVCATGVLHQPRIPDIPGLESFGGTMFHSARWDDSVPLDGARIGVVGTGSTGVQLTTALAEVSEQLTLFQRTAQWVLALPNPALPNGFRVALDRVPALNRGMYDLTRRIYLTIGNAPIRAGWQRKAFGFLARRSLATVADPALRARLTPTDEPLCKRMVNSGGFYRAVQQPNVDVVTCGIDSVCADGVITADGTLHELDILVLATGFDSHAYMRPMQLSGPTGATLADAWCDGPRAHNTTMIPGLPNLFVLMGPNSPIGNSSLVPIAEIQADYVVAWLRRMRERGIVEIEPTAAATDRFYDEVGEAMDGTVWVSGCDSWYLGPDGVPLLWPWPLEEFRRRLASPDPADFIVRTAPSRTAETQPTAMST